MITIESGKLTIPDEERFIGFAGDNLSNEIQIGLLHHTDRGCTFTLCLRFDDGTVREVQLGAYYYSSDVMLTWEVSREDLYSSGIVTAQIRIDYPDGEVVHSTKDYFFVRSSLDSDSDSGDLVTRAELMREFANALTRAESYTDQATQGLVNADDVYTKLQIDAMIGDLETVLAEV